MAKNGEITSRQKRMIRALLSSKTIGEACEAAKVGRSTLARWLKDTDFQKELGAAEREAVSHAARELMAGQSEALGTIRDLMANAANEAVRLRAANNWVNLLFQYRELNNLEERITKLEERSL